MKFTIANHNNEKNPKGFKNYDVDFIDIPDIVTSGSCYCSCRLKNEYRLDSNFDGGVDVLILDIDDNCNINQAKEIFKVYNHYIITTKSHQKNKNGLVCDKFRVFIELEETIETRDKYNDFIKYIYNLYPFIDQSCKNPSRLFFTSLKDALILKNDGRKMKVNHIEIKEQPKQKEKKTININYESVYILNELTGLWVNDFGETLENQSLDDTEAKLKGASVLLDREFFKGNRNNAMFNCICMLLNDGLNDDIVLNFITAENDIRGKIPFNELMACFKSAKRTI